MTESQPPWWFEEDPDYCPDCHYIGCRCFWCGRCNQLTGNTSQGHYWTYCSKTKKMEVPHFCCPTMECEYEK